jgi:DNA-binding MarR family transcriptional regulator
MSGKRKSRSDKGQVRATERDFKIMTYIGEQYAISLDHLKKLLEMEKGEGLSESTVKRLCTRWENAGWIEKKKLLAYRPQWVWLTRTGLQEMELDYPHRAPSLARLNHIYYANAVRLHIEEKHGDAVEWRSDRLVNVERKADKKKHIIDGELLFQGAVIAIEVELSKKSKKRLSSILRELRRDYKYVWHFAADECYQVVKEAIENIPNHRETFVLYSLSNILKEDE